VGNRFGPAVPRSATDRAATEKELSELAQIAATRDSASLDQVAYWDTGSPSYRWSEIAVAAHLKEGTNWQIAARDLSLMHIAIYDAMVAAWGSKYAYDRPKGDPDRRRLLHAQAPPPAGSVSAGACAACPTCVVLSERRPVEGSCSTTAFWPGVSSVKSTTRPLGNSSAS
jgi:hypothetical protein